MPVQVAILCTSNYYKYHTYDDNLQIKWPHGTQPMLTSRIVLIVCEIFCIHKVYFHSEQADVFSG